MKKRLLVIDYLKAICVLLVILTHGSNINPDMLDKRGLFYLLAVNKCVPVFMFLSGYVYTLGGDKRIRNRYSPNIIVPKIARLTIPTVIAYIVFVILNFVAGRHVDIAETLLLSNFGPGSYYFPVMIQFVVSAPLIYFIVKKFNVSGVVMMGIVNLIYEAAASFSGLDIQYYRIIFLRYLLIVSFGMYFGINREMKLNTFAIISMAAAGLLYILSPITSGYEYKIFTISPWNRSNMMSAFYVAALTAVILKMFGDVQETGKFSRLVSRVGQASYHIMYTQMIYFVARYGFDRFFDITRLPILVQCTVDIVLPVTSGILFCMLDNKLFGKIYKLSGKKIRKLC